MKRYLCLLIAIVVTLTMFSGCKRSEDEGQAIAGNVDSVADTKPEQNTDTVVTPDTPEKQPENTAPEPEQTPEQKPEPETPVQKPSATTPSYTLPEDADTDDIEEVIPEEDVVTEPEVDEYNLPLEFKQNVGTKAKVVDITKESFNLTQLQLPKINLVVPGGENTINNTSYVRGTVSIENTEPQYTLKSTAVDIRGRGNSTWLCFDKKPYKIKFLMKTDLFGMGAAKKWVLFACGCMDETMVRNALAYDLAKQLGVEYTTEYQYINLFLNGDYKGVYLLLEQQEEGDTRIDVNTSKTGEIDTGYFLEMWNNTWDTIDKPLFEMPKVNGIRTTAYCVIKSPDEKIIKNQQFTYIQDYILKTNEAILKKDWQKINELCDIDSFVNMFLVDTVFLNHDAGHSFYLYKRKGEKICLGPIWDIDQSSGSSSHGDKSYMGWNIGSKHHWYRALIEIPEFRELVRNRYNENKDYIRGIVDRVDKIATKNAYDFGMSNYVYNNFGNPSRVKTMPEIVALESYADHLAYLRTWFTNRIIWLEANLEIK